MNNVTISYKQCGFVYLIPHSYVFFSIFERACDDELIHIFFLKSEK